MQVPTYQNKETLQPSEWNPKAAAVIGNEVADVGQGLEGMGEQIQKLDNRRQTLKAETYLAKQHLQKIPDVQVLMDIQELPDGKMAVVIDPDGHSVELSGI